GGAAMVVFPTDRTVLPIPEPQYPHSTVIDARNATPPPRFEIKAPTNAPNVLIVLVDDMGFGQSSAFGGPIHMPTVERLANNGLRYNQFHTTALCSPTRAALLSGRNHHSASTGVIMELATGFPGYNSLMSKSNGTFAEVLKQNGYNTAWYGKNHNVPDWHTSQAGPFDLWPTGLGFEYFYGFIGGDTSQWSPALFEGTKPIEPPHDAKDYFFDKDMADHAIARIQMLHAVAPDKPWLTYYAPGTAHAPHHAPPEWIDKFKGKFDQGWDKVREETLARQIQLGVVPAGTKLAPKPKDIRDWDALSADEQRLFARQMEVFAGFAEYADHEVGRLVNALAEMGVMDNTLFL
ncbi:MAG: sulfatase-like hydrolase/transferase, partial [Pseudomonadota bacterium]